MAGCICASAIDYSKCFLLGREVIDSRISADLAKHGLKEAALLPGALKDSLLPTELLQRQQHVHLRACNHASVPYMLHAGIITMHRSILDQSPSACTGPSEAPGKLGKNTWDYRTSFTAAPEHQM